MKLTLLRTPDAESSNSIHSLHLKNLYRQKKLTSLLEILEKRGLRGDAAIFILSNLGGEV